MRSTNRQLRSSPRRVRCSWVKVPSVELGGLRRNSREPVRAARQEGWSSLGVLRSSEEPPVTGAERRQDTCPDVSSGTWPKALQRDKPRGRKVPNIDCGRGGNARAELDSESRIREIRPSGLMRVGIGDSEPTTTVGLIFFLRFRPTLLETMLHKLQSLHGYMRRKQRRVLRRSPTRTGVLPPPDVASGSKQQAADCDNCER